MDDLKPPDSTPVSKPKRGGARPGAGRKSKAVKKLRGDVNAAIERRLLPELDGLLGSLLTLARGVAVQKRDKDGLPETDEAGETIVYVAPPDRQAAEYLINRLAGKPIDRSESGGPGDFDPKKLTDEELQAIAAGKGAGRA